MRKLLGQRGQTAVEYLLMTVVAITIGIAFKKAMTTYMLKNPNSFLNKSLKKLERDFDAAQGYRYYKLP